MVFLYLRTDLWDQELKSGGSVAHTLGVLKGLQDLGYDIIIASSIMHQTLTDHGFSHIRLHNPSWLKFLRWKINCLLSTFFFAWHVRSIMKQKKVTHIYQRYSLLNMTGLVLSWIYKIPLILEYNGSEYWVSVHWVAKKRWLTFGWFVKKIEDLIICKADYIVVVSEVLQHDVLKKGVHQSKILVNPNGVDVAQYQIK